ncbi:keratinocyte differentiation-associated protein isoform X1 [Physeter macrocephalus]|uniref:Keratinocyte differentiation-associated protein isoform X1 n=1 Tax=Physeter macrocephalus TaxID=9755 RepID=A0A9W2W7G0_PHYMC|nr:keratinocyte differentiation-associated protein isoform X1 [Physeter catodon]
MKIPVLAAVVLLSLLAFHSAQGAALGSSEVARSALLPLELRPYQESLGANLQPGKILRSSVPTLSHCAGDGGMSMLDSQVYDRGHRLHRLGSQQVMSEGVTVGNNAAGSKEDSYAQFLDIDKLRSVFKANEFLNWNALLQSVKRRLPFLNWDAFPKLRGMMGASTDAQ